MRILKVTQAYHPFVDAGGPAVKVRAIAKALAGRGHRVTVLTADLGLGLKEGRAAIAEPSRWGRQTHEHGVEAIYLSTLAQYRAMTLNPGLLRFCLERLHTFDLVHIYGLYDLLGPGVAYFCRLDLPYLVEPLGMTRPIDRGFRLKRLWHKLLGNRLLRNASLLIATSEQEQQELTADGFPPAKVRVRYNGVDLREFENLPPRGTFRRKWNIPSDAPMVLFLGRLIPRKGADLLLEAFPRAFPDGGRLVIAGPEGDGGYLEELRRKAVALGLAARVIWPGPLYDEEKNAALADADIFVLPSQYENFANSVAEAIACRTPVIVTERCGISALVSQQAGLVIPRDVQPLVKALQELTANKALYTKLKAGCQQVAAKISWRELGRRMEDCYKEVLAARSVGHG